MSGTSELVLHGYWRSGASYRTRIDVGSLWINCGPEFLKIGALCSLDLAV